MRRLSPGRILAAVRARIAGARYAIEDVLYVIGRFLRRLPRAIARGTSTFWGGLDARMRARLAAALAAIVALVAFVGLAVPSLPCQFPGGDRCPPPDNAADLVPAGALAYVHADLDPAGEQLADAAEVVSKLPAITQELLGDVLELAPGRPMGPVDIALAVAPWFGGEAAVAILAGGQDGADQVTLLAIDDPEGAAEFAEQTILGGSSAGEHRGVEIAIGPVGGDEPDAVELATAQVEEFLVIGGEDGVREVIDVATGAEGASSIADEDAVSELRDQLADDRLADAYLSPDGAVQLVAEADGPLAFLSPFVSPEATQGVAASLGAGDDELELTVRSALDPDRGQAGPGFFGAFAPFEAQLPERLPADSLAYVGFGDPEQTVQALLAQASAEAPGVASGFEGLAGELRRDGEIDIERELLPALGDEAAFVVEPRVDEGEASRAPFLEFVARDVDSDGARNALARLQRPVVDAIEPAIGLQAPVFRDVDIDGADAQSLLVSPAIELTYAVVDDLAVIATDPLGVERLATGDGGLDEAELFERATDGFPETASLLAFGDLGELVLVAERLGLGADPAYAAFAGEIRALNALGVAVRVDDDLLATDIRLIARDPGEGELALPPAPGDELELPLEPELPPDTPGFEPPPEPEESPFGPPPQP